VTSSAPAPLSRDRILECAVRVADRDGLEAASLRRVATELGVHVTSLYNHVPTKEALLDGIAEELLLGADVPLGEVAWEDWVRRFVAAVATMARTHPGAFAVLLRRPVQGPRANATFEAGLAAFHRAGMDVRESYGAVKSVALGVLGVCVEQAYAASDDEDDDARTTNVAALSWQDFPELHQVVDVVDEVDVVAILADVLVAGLAARLPRGRGRSAAR
jgi:AcrR family transcriptional regulator